MKIKLYVVLLVLVATICSCSGEPEDTSSPQDTVGTLVITPAEPVKVGADPVEAAVFEQDSLNVPFWVGRGIKDRTVIRMSGFSGLSKVSDERIAALKGMIERGRMDELKSAADSAGTSPLFDADSVLYVANRLGIVRDVIWVVPIFLSMNEDEAGYFKSFLTEQHPELGEEIRSMKLDGKTATLTLNGIPVKLVGLQDLGPPAGPAVLDIEASFFASLYQGEKNTTTLSFVAGMFKLLSLAGVTSDAVSIVSSGEDRRAPLKFRSMGLYMAEMLKDPDILAGGPPKLWSERAAAWKAEQSDPELALPIYKNIVKTYPEDAATRYDLAELYLRMNKLESCAVELAEAARLDPGYMPGFEQFRDSIENSGEPELAKRFYSRKPAI